MRPTHTPLAPAVVGLRAAQPAQPAGLQRSLPELRRTRQLAGLEGDFHLGLAQPAVLAGADQGQVLLLLWAPQAIPLGRPQLCRSLLAAFRFLGQRAGMPGRLLVLQAMMAKSYWSFTNENAYH